MFTKGGLRELGWSIEDLEEMLGFPRGWTDIDFQVSDNEAARIQVLSRHGFDEEMEQYFEKYGL